MICSRFRAGVALPLIFVMLLALSGCTSGLFKRGGALAFLNTYSKALKEYERGDMMAARNTVINMDKSREDYKDAVKLLRTKIDPDRRRLLRVFVRKAQNAEKSRQWSEAVENYAQAASLSLEPVPLVQKQERMELNMRQARLDAALNQRRKEDSAFLAWAGNYETPRGIAPDDVAYAHLMDTFRDVLDDRASRSYDEAKWFLRKGAPELAYVEAESHLRLQPKSSSGKSLMEDIKSKLPKGLSISALSDFKGSYVRSNAPKSVSEAQLKELMNKGDWLEARRYAVVYRREGGKNASKYLRSIEGKLEEEGATLFQQGSLAFRQEKLDKAIEYWSEAVRYQPNNDEYSDQLRRAKQLRDRLKILKTEPPSAEDAVHE